MAKKQQKNDTLETWKVGSPFASFTLNTPCLTKVKLFGLYGKVLAWELNKRQRQKKTM